MTVSSYTKPRFKKTLIVVSSIIIIAGAAVGTIWLLKHFAPIKMTDTTSTTATDTTSLIKKASDLFAKGDYEGAKTQYRAILETYQSQNNEAGVKDIEMQLKVIDATAQTEKAPQNTDRNRVVAGSEPAQ